MEGGGWAVGGHVLGAAQEPREQQQREEGKEAGAAADRQKGGGGMKFRVRARAPHGVGALLLIGGAAVVGAAVLTWRRSRHGKKGGAVDQPERRLPAKEEALDGGIVEGGMVQGGSLVQKLDQSDENLSAGNTDIGPGRLDGNVSVESHQIHKDTEIAADQLESKHEETIDENSGSNPVEVHTHDLESKHEQEIDENSGSNHVKVHTHELESKHEEKIDENSGSNPVEVHMHDLESKYEQKIDENSGSNHVEVHTHELESKHEEKIDENSGSNPVEVHTHDLESKHEQEIDENSGSNHVEVHTHELESKHEEKIDENSGSNPVEVHTHDLESKHEQEIDENSGSNHVEVHTHELESKHEEKIDENSGSNPVEVHTHDLNKKHVEKVDQKSSSNHVEITAHDMCQDNEHAEKIDHIEGIDHNSSRNPVEIIMQEMVTVCLVNGSVEKVVEDSNKKDIEKEIAQNDNKAMEASDQSKPCINSPGIILSKHNDESDGTQEAESMENTPTAQLMMHQDQLLDDMVTYTVTETEDTVTETEEAKQGERTITGESELEQDEKKDLVGLVELASSPALSSLVKPIVKKEPEFPRPNETGMKIEQDYTNGELREHTDLISKGGAILGEGDMATMDCRSSALVVIALIFALTMGITIFVRLYAPSRATKLQMDLP